MVVRSSRQATRWKSAWRVEASATRSRARVALTPTPGGFAATLSLRTRAPHATSVIRVTISAMEKALSRSGRGRV